MIEIIFILIVTLLFPKTTINLNIDVNEILKDIKMKCDIKIILKRIILILIILSIAYIIPKSLEPIIFITNKSEVTREESSVTIK